MHNHEYVQGAFILIGLIGKLRIVPVEEEAIVEGSDILYVPL